MRILTVGYGNRGFRPFVDLLKRHEVTHIVDVRGLPDSPLHEEYRRPHLAQNLAAVGVAYVSMSDTLSGLENSDALCKASESVDIRPLFDTPKFRLGLATLEKAAAVEGRVICLMCECLVPHRCHRSRLLGTALEAKGIEVLHIDDRGVAVTHEQIVEETTPITHGLNHPSRQIAEARVVCRAVSAPRDV